MTDHFNELPPDLDERLVLVMEECSEVIQIICKIQRHGMYSFHPDSREYNKNILEAELGDLTFVMSFLVENGDVDPREIQEYAQHKRERIQKYLRHNTVKP